MVQRYNPDYVMHAARFEPFARENEHGEFVKFSDYEALVSELASIRQINAQTLQVKLGMADTIKELEGRVNALAVENAALSAALSLISGSYGLSPHIQSMCAVDTPTTDAALAAIHAQGVEKFSDFLGKQYQCEKANTAKGNAYKHVVFLACRFARELREAK
ncbi:hypothetical protein [Serratia nevei]|uniref:hypothetical protein n=1 Tax=Serratia nevei TaxID=2703794 RepID=UPI0037DD2AE8